jgi:hypothetical protein
MEIPGENQGNLKCGVFFLRRPEFKDKLFDNLRKNCRQPTDKLWQTPDVFRQFGKNSDKKKPLQGSGRSNASINPA